MSVTNPGKIISLAHRPFSTSASAALFFEQSPPFRNAPILHQDIRILRMRHSTVFTGVDRHKPGFSSLLFFGINRNTHLISEQIRMMQSFAVTKPFTRVRLSSILRFRSGVLRFTFRSSSSLLSEITASISMIAVVASYQAGHTAGSVDVPS